MNAFCVLSPRVMNVDAVTSEQSQNFTLYSKRCNCSAEELCSHRANDTTVIPFLSYEQLEVDSDRYNVHTYMMQMFMCTVPQ